MLGCVILALTLIAGGDEGLNGFSEAWPAEATSDAFVGGKKAGVAPITGPTKLGKNPRAPRRRWGNV